MVASQQNKRAIGVFAKSQVVEQALNELKASGFPMEKVSIIAKNVEQGEQPSGAKASDRVGNQNVGTPTGVVADTLTAATWGSLLVGLGSLAIPGVGAIVAAGSVGAALLTTLTGNAVGAVATGNLVRALADTGIPEEQARVYSDRLLAGAYLAIVEGTDDEIHRAESIFSSGGIQDWGVYNSSKT